MYFSLICESVENTSFLKSYSFVTILLQLVFRSFSAVIHLYTRCLCILIWDSCFLGGEVYGNSLGKEYGFDWLDTMFSIDLLPPTHTTHTTQHVYWCVVSRYPGGGKRVQSVCVLLQRAFTNDKACLFSIATRFRYSNHDNRRLALTVFSVVICLRLRRYAPPNTQAT